MLDCLIPTRVDPIGFIPTVIRKNRSRPNGIYKKRKFRAAKKGGINIENGHTTAISIPPSENGGKSCCCQKKQSSRKRGLPPPTQVKFTAFHDRSRIVNVYKRIETFINVSFTTNFEKSRKLLSVGVGVYPPRGEMYFFFVNLFQDVIE